VPVETLEFGEEIGIGKIRIDDADRIALIDGSHYGVAGAPYGLHVARGNIAGGSD
jgi:hypothetical protein